LGELWLVAHFGDTLDLEWDIRDLEWDIPAWVLAVFINKERNSIDREAVSFLFLT
jgi:hypothetical protein